LKGLSEENGRQITIFRGEKKTVRTYTWVNDISYKNFMLNRSECVEESAGETTGFVSVSSPKADYFRVPEITETGHKRRKKENGGSDIRKNHGTDPVINIQGFL
jgi:hypothetical protein